MPQQRGEVLGYFSIPHVGDGLCRQGLEKRGHQSVWVHVFSHRPVNVAVPVVLPRLFEWIKSVPLGAFDLAPNDSLFVDLEWSCAKGRPEGPLSGLSSSLGGTPYGLGVGIILIDSTFLVEVLGVP